MTTVKSKDINHTVYCYLSSYYQDIDAKSFEKTFVQKYDCK